MTYTSESESSEAVESRLPLVSRLSFKESDHVKPSLEDNFEKKVHFCEVGDCTAAFSRPWRLEAHLAVHSGQKPFPCDYDGCDKAYTSNFHLRRHKLTTHTQKLNQKKFRCDYIGCDKEFTLLQNVKKHFRRSHVSQNKTCKICGKLFFNHLQLKKHNRIHKLGYNLKCSTCNITFDHAEQYYRHNRGHRIYVCPIKECAAAFKNWSLLRKHLAIHPKDFICHYCKRGYRSKKYMKAHILRHLNGSIKRKPYVLPKVTCDICQAQLVGKASLKRHKKKIHETKSEVTQKPIKPRAPRKDKGIPKRALAAVLSQVILPRDVEKKLIESPAIHILDFSEL